MRDEKSNIDNYRLVGVIDYSTGLTAFVLIFLGNG